MTTTINAGRVAMVPKGEWSASTAYTRLDVVLYQGSAWVCIKDGTGQEPAQGSTYWQLLAAGITASDYYTKTQVDTKIEESSPVRVRATWNASTSAYVSETDVDTMYSIFYTQGKVLELHLVNGNWNGLVLACRGGHTEGNVRHMVFGGVGMGMIVYADVVGTAVTVVYDSIGDIWDELGGKQDNRLLVTITQSGTDLVADVVVSDIIQAISAGRDVLAVYGIGGRLTEYYKVESYNQQTRTLVWGLARGIGIKTLSQTGASVTLESKTFAEAAALAGKQDVSPITNAASGALMVNEYRDFGSVSALTVTLTGGTMTNYDLYKFAFTCASDSTTLTLPSGVKLPVDMEMEMATGRRFECVIDYAGCLTYNCWD